MSVVSLARPPRIRASASRRHAAELLRLIMAACAVVVRELRVRREMQRLAEYDDRMLHDIGIVRADIEGSIRHGRD
jgi:uncharacterized protein YjiS (DUF1127 family)